jgi:hypothetical protein
MVVPFAIRLQLSAIAVAKESMKPNLTYGIQDSLALPCSVGLQTSMSEFKLKCLFE